ncbi:hypothetical protein [Nitrososphaera viennensis]|uniref:Polymer-forming cytoskeletal protein n=2 Tax=Nitrososphaera viennensis TaxID=1034015 RepID=A0A060HUB5_9ARCH|nr:hypothetical protein [Nitrososphaera viennensis]AIC17016.1 hypothetical protein NVIE_027390 [Nitrososphaera viennensis EN76]UVS68914.1 hypothetical protein NWT39_13530 [Nitrososphaera viennensis]
MQEDVRVERGGSAALGRVEGNLSADKDATIEAADGGKVTVAGSARFRGDCTVNCDLECRSLRVEKGTLKIAGNLQVHGDADIANALYVDGSIVAADGIIAVGGTVKAGSVKCRIIKVGGTLEVSDTLDAESVKVGRKMVSQRARLVDLNVGGQAEIGSGAVQGQIKVGGTFQSKSELEFDSISVGGKVELGTGMGRSIKVGGRLATTGDLTCEEIKVGGIVEIGGNCSGEILEVGGETKVFGSLVLTGKLGVGGDLQVRDALTGTDMRVGGRFSGSKAMLAGRAWIGGQVETSAGLKAGGEIKISPHAECKGPLVGGTVELGKRCKVQDVYGSKVVVGKGAEAEKIVADEIEIHDDGTVGQATYTRRLETGRNAVCRNPPEKTASLAAFPL